MSQTKRRSRIEATVNIVVGLVYAVLLNYFLLNYVTWSGPWSQSIWITIWFTLGSYIRQYYLRRIFNLWDIRSPSNVLDESKL